MSADPGPEPLFEAEGPTEQERLRNQLGAVELLLAHRERDVAHHDILLATVFEILSAGPLAGHEIARHVREIWPSLRLLDAHVESALAAAADLGLIQPEPVPGRSTIWRLLDGGRRHLEEAGERAASLQNRLQQQVVDEVRDQGFVLNDAECTALVGVVIAALRHGVADCFRGLGDDRVEQVGGWLRVVEPDLDRVTAFIDVRVPDQDRADLVKALVNLAFNQAANLGNEVVHHLIAGHLLYVFMARPDRSAAAATAGSLAGEQFILDTPFLLRLLGPTETRQPVLDLLATARTAGVKVLVLERTRLELQRLLDGAETRVVPGVEDDLKRADPEVLAGIHRADEVIWNWLMWAQRSAGTDHRWSAWRQGPNGPDQLFATLSAIGISVVSSAWDGVNDTDYFNQFKRQLLAQLKDSSRERGERVVEHDARNLVDLRRARVAHPASATKVWPGAFILTPDTQLSSVYEAVVGPQTLPATLTFSQAAQIVGAYADPRTGEKLAFDVASGVAEQVLLSRAVNIPGELAQKLATATATEPTTLLEVEQMQLDLRRAFDVSRNVLEPGSVDHQTVVDSVTRQMRERRAAMRERSTHAATEERVRQASVDARRTEVLRTREEENALLRSEKEQVERELTATKEREANAARRLALQRRQHWAERVAGVFLLGAVALLAGGSTWSGVSLLVTALAVFVYGREWADGKVSVGAAGLAVISIVSSLYPLLPENDEAPSEPPSGQEEEDGTTSTTG